MAGSMNIPMAANGRKELVLTRVDNIGNVIWNKTFKSPLVIDTTTGEFDIYQIKEDGDHNIYVSGTLWDGFPLSAIVLKFSSAGNLLWSKAFYSYYYTYGFGIELLSNEVILFGKHLRDPVGTITMVIRMDSLTGDTIATKGMYMPEGALHSWAAHCYLTKLDNGNIAISGNLYGDGAGFSSDGIQRHFGTAELDQSLNFISGVEFSSHMNSNRYDSRISVNEDGSASFSLLRSYSIYSSDLIFGKYKFGQIVKERIQYRRGSGGFRLSNFLSFNGGQDVVQRTFRDSLKLYGSIEYFNFHQSDTGSSCLGKDTSLITLSPLTMIDTVVYFDMVSNNVLEETFRTPVTVLNESLSKTNYCEQTTFCDTLKIASLIDTICSTQPVTIVAHKNRQCGSEILWTFDSSAVQSYYYLNDTTLQIKFRNSWQGYIYGEIRGCSVLKDSVKIVAFLSPDSLNIGPDTTFCPNTTILLNAHTGFINYLWQNNSTDSFFIVTQPGTYYVQTKNACGDIFNDTVIVFPSSPIIFDIGADVAKCNKDTIAISAPAGFFNYLWTPRYNILNAATSTAFVYPFVSTRYFVTAEKFPGCFVRDSIIVDVNISHDINLGTDITICKNDSTLLDAGSGFVSYLWNTGDHTPKLIATTAGQYFVIASDNNKCKSSDSIIITTKSCLKGFYVPGAFTPNNDSKNDIFKPVILDPILKYHFTIHNRYGQKVFESSDISLGWDGKINGIYQNSGVFIWQCEYQLVSGYEIFEKGSVVLLK